MGTKAYDPDFGDDRKCECGHPYYRHFDSHEANAPVGCKYCSCDDWKKPDAVLNDPYLWKDKDGKLHQIMDMPNDYLSAVLKFLADKKDMRPDQLPVLISVARRRGIKISSNFDHIKVP